jgi:hypothetical protein
MVGIVAPARPLLEATCPFRAGALRILVHNPLLGWRMLNMLRLTQLCLK